MMDFMKPGASCYFRLAVERGLSSPLQRSTAVQLQNSLQRSWIIAHCSGLESPRSGRRSRFAGGNIQMCCLKPGRIANVIFALSLVLSCFLGFRVSANPLRDPRRVINGGRVDLTPLFHWWTNHAGARPLTAWVHVTGPIQSETAGGWVIDAQVEPSSAAASDKTAHSAHAGGHLKIILRTPPVAERAEFERLAAELKQLEAQHDKLSKQESDADKQARHAAAQEHGRHLRPYRAAQFANQAAQADEAKITTQSDLSELDKQIQAVRVKMAPYPNKEKYEVDCIALDADQEHSGMAVFDHGMVVH